MSLRIVIAGAGQAGCQLAVSLRERKFDGEITLVGEECCLPYQKPPMSKGFLLGKIEESDLALKPESYFAQKGISFLCGSRVTEIDCASRRAVIDDQSSLDFDHLVIAAGAENRLLPVPGADLDGVLMLRSLRDAAILKQRLSQAKRLVIVGAGFIGMEAAAVARQFGLDVTVIERVDRVLARAVSRPTSDYILMRHLEGGVTFRFNTGVDAFAGDHGRLAAVHLSDGEVIPTDLALVAIGVVPTIGLAEQAGLLVGDGILVDGMLTTADPSVHAIGDCVNFPHPLLDGRRVRIESVQNAVDQARCLAMTLTGTPTPYTNVPWFWSDQWDIRLQMAGIAGEHDEAIIRGDPSDGRFSALRTRDGRLTAVESINHVSDHMAARRLIASRPRLDPAGIRDLSVPLKDIAMAYEGANG